MDGHITMKNKRNSKKIQRDVKLEIRMSKEEKDFWYAYAEKLGVPPTRLARNILMTEAESNLNVIIGKPIIKAYRYYLEATNQQERLNEISQDN